jgi:hypothetical protein
MSSTSAMQSNQVRDERGRDTLEIDAELTHGNVTTEILLVNTTKRAQKIAHRSPHPLNGIDMHLADAVAVVITCPLFRLVRNRRVRADDVVVALPFVSVHLATSLGVPVDTIVQSLFVGVLNHAQTHLPTLAPYCANDWRSVVVVSAMPPPFVGPSAGRTARISVQLYYPTNDTLRERARVQCTT